MSSVTKMKVSPGDTDTDDNSRPTKVARVDDDCTHTLPGTGEADVRKLSAVSTTVVLHSRDGAQISYEVQPPPPGLYDGTRFTRLRVLLLVVHCFLECVGICGSYRLFAWIWVTICIYIGH
eukprot:m.133064 g.133064  ORF g.133064 m.133064 type:complete len:121 (-) comp17523_c0_seq7:1610-1972(-)